MQKAGNAVYGDFRSCAARFGMLDQFSNGASFRRSIRRKSSVQSRTDISSAAGKETFCQDPGTWKQDDQLSGNRNDKAVDTVSQSLEGGADDDAVAGQHKMNADDPKGRDPDGDHVIGSIKKAQ